MIIHPWLSALVVQRHQGCQGDTEDTAVVTLFPLSLAYQPTREKQALFSPHAWPVGDPPVNSQHTQLDEIILGEATPAGSTELQGVRVRGPRGGV